MEPNSVYTGNINVCLGRDCKLYELKGVEGFAVQIAEGRYEFLISGYDWEEDNYIIRVHEKNLEFLRQPESRLPLI